MILYTPLEMSQNESGESRQKHPGTHPRLTYATKSVCIHKKKQFFAASL